MPGSIHLVMGSFQNETFRPKSQGSCVHSPQLWCFLSQCVKRISEWIFFFFENPLLDYTANVYRELQGLYREIGVQEFQIYGDCMYTRNPCNFEIPHSYFHCNICREFDFTGILQGFPALDVGKPCNNLIFLKYPCKICRDNL